MSNATGMSGLFPRLPLPDVVACLPDAGDGLASALADLARDPSVTRCDEVMARLQSSGHAVQRLRRLLAEGEQS